MILTEKPDVAKHVAEFFGIEQKLKGAYRLKNGDWVTYNVGHLLDLGTPEDYMSEAQKAARGFAQLPILPKPFRHFPDPEKLEQLKTVVKLLKEADIIVNAGDIDREGQWIADEVIAYAGIDPAGATKPVERVLIRANNDASLRTAFDPSNRRKNGEAEFVHRRTAGQARSEADWLVGMNGSRGVRSRIAARLDTTLSVGRVQTPTLGLVVQRELDIQNFKSLTYYVPEVVLLNGRVLTWSSHVEGASMQGIDAEGRIIDLRVAEAIVARINAGQIGQVTAFTAIEREQAPPLPFNLAKLQSEMSARCAMSAKETSAATQSLYQTRKMVSYVGTDCQYLPSSMHTEASQVLKGLSASYLKLASGANPKIRYACWNDAKVSAHHAIIPTGEQAQGLSNYERKVFDAIARRYMAQFYPKHVFLDSRLEAQYGEDLFKSSWKTTQVLGWKAVDAPVDEDHSEAADMENKMAMRMRHP
ncbi:DNA topoisomerase [Candidatus Glomeribacter gigasporarum]|uniref:DNA topoisomerase n=1 Tax=Candidatus Glomeribacter gigasporarum TaxID=132144 RepID=UPI00193A5F97|nr:DNA topoisomerase [Candidatus Glomeribacter gigasporarum]